MTQQRPPSGPWRPVAIIGLTAVTIAVAVLVAVIVGGRDNGTAVAEDPAHPRISSGSTGDPDADDLAAKEDLTLDAAKQVWDLHQSAKDAEDVDSFAQATCQEFIDADIELRGLTDTASLLDAYRRAKKFVPVQEIADAQVLAASGHAPADGQVQVSASITDNWKVPPTPQRRTFTVVMKWEKERWKLCPTIDPV
ncbi:hypothetical protein [Gordonia malaquae]|uniref:hypothetical protein n=1 Tax=Gordonia malaquae TaxID=410332 RepID=UPI0030198678